MFQGIRTFIGIAIAAVPTFAGLFGFDVSPNFETQALSIVDEVITLVGLGIALYGRLVAVTPGWFAKKA